MTGLSIGNIVSKAMPNGPGKKAKRSGDPVHRGSVDVFHADARKRRAFGNGTDADGFDVRDAFMKVAEEHQAAAAKATKGKHGVLLQSGLAVLRALLYKIDFKSGTVDSAQSQLEAQTGLSHETISKALVRLRDGGWLDWLRRTISTGAQKAFGIPQRIQISNLYFITFERLSATASARFKELLAKARLRRLARAKAQGRPEKAPPATKTGAGRQMDPAVLNPHGHAAAKATTAHAVRAAVTHGEDETARALAFAEAWAKTHHANQES